MNSKRKAKEPYNVDALVSNMRLIFKTGDIDKLNNPTYQFIITHMGFIAHYNIHGFRQQYRSANGSFMRLRFKLQQSEHSQDMNWNLDHADRLEKRMEDREYNQSIAAAMRAIIDLAQNYKPLQKPPQLPSIVELETRIRTVVTELNGLLTAIVNDEIDQPTNDTEVAPVAGDLANVEAAIEQLTTIFWQQLTEDGHEQLSFFSPGG